MLDIHVKHWEETKRVDSGPYLSWQPLGAACLQRKTPSAFPSLMLRVLKETLSFPVRAPNGMEVRKSGTSCLMKTVRAGRSRGAGRHPCTLQFTPSLGLLHNPHTKLTHLKCTHISPYGHFNRHLKSSLLKYSQLWKFS